MNFNNFTIKSQEAVQQAVNLTQARGQQAIEPVHLLAGVLKVGENVTNFIFQKLHYKIELSPLATASVICCQISVLESFFYTHNIVFSNTISSSTERT